MEITTHRGDPAGSGPPDDAAGAPDLPLSPQDRMEIHELVALHGHLADARRADELGLLLTPDAVYDLRALGLDDIDGLPAIQETHRRPPGEQPIGHHVTNVVVRRRPDGTVSVRSKGLAVLADGRAGTCTYDDVVVRTAAGWRISRRRVLPAGAG